MKVYALLGVDDGIQYEDPGREEVITLFKNRGSAEEALRFWNTLHDSEIYTRNYIRERHEIVYGSTRMYERVEIREHEVRE